MEYTQLMESWNHYYWLDKGFHQTFDYSNMVDLIVRVCGGSDRLVLSGGLLGEYSRHNTPRTAQNTLAITSGGDLTTTVLNSASGTLSLSAQHVVLSGSFYGGSGSSTHLLTVPSGDLQIIADAQGATNALTTDHEGILLARDFGIIPLTNDSGIIRVMEGSDLPYFRPTDILVANVAAGHLEHKVATRFWNEWKAKDPAWVSPTHKTFDDCWTARDENKIRKYLKVTT